MEEAWAVELTRVGVAALRAQRERQLEERLAAGSRWDVPRMAKSRRYNLGTSSSPPGTALTSIPPTSAPATLGPSSSVLNCLE